MQGSSVFWRKSPLNCSSESQELHQIIEYLWNYLTLFPLPSAHSSYRLWTTAWVKCVIFRYPTKGVCSLVGRIKYSLCPIGREQKCGVEKGAWEMMAVFTSVWWCPAGWSGFSPRSLVLGSPGLRSFLKKIHEAELKWSTSGLWTQGRRRAQRPDRSRARGGWVGKGRESRNWRVMHNQSGRSYFEMKLNSLFRGANTASKWATTQTGKKV